MTVEIKCHRHKRDVFMMYSNYLFYQSILLIFYFDSHFVQTECSLLFLSKENPLNIITHNPKTADEQVDYFDQPATLQRMIPTRRPQNIVTDSLHAETSAVLEYVLYQNEAIQSASPPIKIYRYVAEKPSLDLENLDRDKSLKAYPEIDEIQNFNLKSTRAHLENDNYYQPLSPVARTTTEHRNQPLRTIAVTENDYQVSRTFSNLEKINRYEPIRTTTDPDVLGNYNLKKSTLANRNSYTTLRKDLEKMHVNQRSRTLDNIKRYETIIRVPNAENIKDLPMRTITVSENIDQYQSLRTLSTLDNDYEPVRSHRPSDSYYQYEAPRTSSLSQETVHPDDVFNFQLQQNVNPDKLVKTHPSLDKIYRYELERVSSPDKVYPYLPLRTSIAQKSDITMYGFHPSRPSLSPDYLNQYKPFKFSALYIDAPSRTGKNTLPNIRKWEILDGLNESADEPVRTVHLPKIAYRIESSRSSINNYPEPSRTPLLLNRRKETNQFTPVLARRTSIASIVSKNKAEFTPLLRSETGNMKQWESLNTNKSSDDYWIEFMQGVPESKQMNENLFEGLTPSPTTKNIYENKKQLKTLVVGGNLYQLLSFETSRVADDYWNEFIRNERVKTYETFPIRVPFRTAKLHDSPATSSNEGELLRTISQEQMSYQSKPLKTAIPYDFFYQNIPARTSMIPQTEHQYEPLRTSGSLQSVYQYQSLTTSGSPKSVHQYQPLRTSGSPQSVYQYQPLTTSGSHQSVHQYQPYQSKPLKTAIPYDFFYQIIPARTSMIPQTEHQYEPLRTSESPQSVHRYQTSRTSESPQSVYQYQPLRTSRLPQYVRLYQRLRTSRSTQPIRQYQLLRTSRSSQTVHQSEPLRTSRLAEDFYQNAPLRNYFYNKLDASSYKSVLTRSTTPDQDIYQHEPLRSEDDLNSNSSVRFSSPSQNFSFDEPARSSRPSDHLYRTEVIRTTLPAQDVLQHETYKPPVSLVTANESSTRSTSATFSETRARQGFKTLWQPTATTTTSTKKVTRITPGESLTPTRTTKIFNWNFNDADAAWPKVELLLSTTESTTAATTAKRKFARYFPFYLRTLKEESTDSSFRIETKAETTTALSNATKTDDFPGNDENKKHFIAREGIEARCYSCGLNKTMIPYYPSCYHIFEQSGTIHSIRKRDFKVHCKNRNIEKRVAHDYTVPDKRQLYRGGCFKRYIEFGDVYSERGCRTMEPILGQSFASYRLASLERVLADVDEGCVTSPHASLTPFARGISLYATYHVCVCQGRYCNNAHMITPCFLIALLNIILSI